MTARQHDQAGRNIADIAWGIGAFLGTGGDRWPEAAAAEHVAAKLGSMARLLGVDPLDLYSAAESLHQAHVDFMRVFTPSVKRAVLAATDQQQAGERAFDPSDWECLFAEAGRIQAAMWDLNLSGDTDAATDVIRPALREMRDALAVILAHFDIEAGDRHQAGDDQQPPASSESDDDRQREARLEAEGFHQWREREDAIADLIALRRQHQGPPPGWNPADADEMTLAVKGNFKDDPDPFGDALRDPAAGGEQ